MISFLFLPHDSTQFTKIFTDEYVFFFYIFSCSSYEFSSKSAAFPSTLLYSCFKNIYICVQLWMPTDSLLGLLRRHDYNCYCFSNPYYWAGFYYLNYIHLLWESREDSGQVSCRKTRKAIDFVWPLPTYYESIEQALYFLINIYWPQFFYFFFTSHYITFLSPNFYLVCSFFILMAFFILILYSIALVANEEYFSELGPE